MKIIVTGSLGHISQPLAKDLVQSGHLRRLRTAQAKLYGEGNAGTVCKGICGFIF